MARKKQSAALKDAHSVTIYVVSESSIDERPFDEVARDVKSASGLDCAYIVQDDYGVEHLYCGGLEWTPVEEDTEDTAVYVPGTDKQYHIADGNGGTLCGERFADNDPWINKICDKCTAIRDGNK